MKPTVNISNAFIIGDHLYGTVHNYPENHMVRPGCVSNNKGTVRTSKILYKKGNIVETQRTIYNVLNWEE